MEELKKKPAPGKKWWKNLSFRVKWLITAIVGLFLINFGVWNIDEAIDRKNQNLGFEIWGAWAIYGVAILSIGLIVFGQSILYKVLIINKKVYKKALKQSIEEKHKLRKKNKAYLGPLP